MTHEEIKSKIDSYPRWHYQFNLKGNLTPVFKSGHVNRHFERENYFIRPVVDLFGGTLKGKRVLDLGCNAGYWSKCVLDHGCDFVLGVDGREMHIDQANFVFEVNEFDKSRYKFKQGNIYEYDFQEDGPFDIVLCLGLFYHISKPMELLEIITRVNKDILIIDTGLSWKTGEFLEVRHDNLDEPRDAFDYELVFYPTKKAMLEMMRQFNYSAIMLKPRFRDYTGSLDYRRGSRRAFLGSRTTDLSPLGDTEETIGFKSNIQDTFNFYLRKPGSVIKAFLMGK